MKCSEMKCHNKIGNECLIFGFIGSDNSRPRQCNQELISEVDLLRQNILKNEYIQVDQLRRLCKIYDVVNGKYPESTFEGESVYNWISGLLYSKIIE